MAKRKTKDIQPMRELVQLTDSVEMLKLCVRMTHLKLDPVCHMDRAYAERWYREHYINGVHARYVMKPGMSINHIGDGIVYRAFNCTDAIAARLMRENREYINYFEDLGEFVLPGQSVVEDTPTVIPEIEEEGAETEEEGAETEEEGAEDTPTVIPETEDTPKEEESPKEETPAAPEDDKVLEDLEKELNEEK
jgi:hypothetical protein|nr:MAG TPA: hypothetical protein [Caudoviricetes sp.]